MPECDDCGRTFVTEDSLHKHQSAPEPGVAPTEGHDVPEDAPCATVRARNTSDEEAIFRVERWSDFPEGEEPACADCGTYRDLIGPVSLDGDVTEGADMVCPACAEDRGLDLSYCTCGTASPADMTCPGCGDYLGYEGDR